MKRIQQTVRSFMNDLANVFATIGCLILLFLIALLVVTIGAALMGHRVVFQ